MQLKLLYVFHWTYKFSQQYFQWKAFVQRLSSQLWSLLPLQCILQCQSACWSDSGPGAELLSAVKCAHVRVRNLVFFEVLSLQGIERWVPKTCELMLPLQFTIVGTSNMSKLTTGICLIFAAGTLMNVWLPFFMVSNRKAFNVIQWSQGWEEGRETLQGDKSEDYKVRPQ